IGADGVRSTVRRQLMPDVDLRWAGYIGWRGMAEERAISPSTYEAMFRWFAWGLPPGEHILGYPVPGADDDFTPGRRRFSFVWYRPVTPERLADMLTDAEGRHHPDGIPPHLIRPDVAKAVQADASRLLSPGW